MLSFELPSSMPSLTNAKKIHIPKNQRKIPVQDNVWHVSDIIAFDAR